MKIGLTFDLKTDWPRGADDPHDANAEFDAPATVDMLERAIASGGHTVERIGNVRQLIPRLGSLDVDIVFNVCEGRSGRNRESQVPVLLEMYGIPYVGADALTLGLTLDKVIAKKVFLGEGIRTPRFYQTDDPAAADELNTMEYPLIVKTRHEGSSKGLDGGSRVEDAAQLRDRVQYITGRYHQPALVEEYVAGKEFTVAVLGNRQPVAMPVVQISIEGKVDFKREIYTHALICSTALKYICPPAIPAEQVREIQDMAVRVFRAVDCRDMARIDFRMDAAGRPYVLEINPLPTLDETDVFHIFPKIFGLDFNGTINIILNLALSRYGLTELDEKDILRPFLTETAV
ncbi:MAG: ATP-grasp domain-containing protein [Candidatus Omnitrophica bacterium]|nr:ATP-grasp domain-containing protein [Candidatus Omnitrophota bacterium]MCB9719825.1 ATP-grasp domain-containing protein [Candidatus Omnitrophota bacterium]